MQLRGYYFPRFSSQQNSNKSHRVAENDSLLGCYAVRVKITDVSEVLIASIISAQYPTNQPKS
jgi:hypothetical protein